jgi:multidrug efflux pump subunit AcrA (membrane-fusion protein)
MKYADAQREGRVPEFLDDLAHDLEGSGEIRLTAREWLARDDFRSEVGPLLRARKALAALAVAATLIVHACSSAAGKPATNGGDALPVNMIKVEPLELRREVEAVGTLAARDETVVSAEVEARVARLAADMGDRVAANAPLVFLDGEKLRYRVDEQRAVLEQTRARLGASGTELPAAEQTPDVVSALAQRVEAEQRLARAKQLAEKNLLPAQELERAQTELETAKAAHQTALAAARNLLAEVRAREATLNSANRDLQDTVIRAPFDGVVAERLVSPGQFVRVQTPVMVVVDNDPMRVKLKVPEKMVGWVAVGQAVEVRVEAYPDRSFTGTISRMSPSVEPDTRSLEVEALLANEQGLLKPGFFARAAIASSHVDRALLVPKEALRYLYGVYKVYAVDKDTLRETEVKLGRRDGEEAEIVEGLKEGDRVALPVAGEDLRDGAPVAAAQ